MNFLNFVSALVDRPAATEPPPGATHRPVFDILEMLKGALGQMEPAAKTWLDAHVEQAVPGTLGPLADKAVNAVLDGALTVAEGEAGPGVVALEAALETRFGQGAVAKLEQVLGGAVQAAVEPTPELKDPNLAAADAAAGDATAQAASVDAKVTKKP